MASRRPVLLADGTNRTGRRPARRRNNPVAGGLAVAVVGGLVAAAIVTGTPASAARTAAAHRLVPASRSESGVRMATATLPDVSSALRALVIPSSSAGYDVRGRAVSRAARRQPLHRWVRPFWGVFSSGFGMRWGRLHAGIDLAGPYGATIVAATDGCITYAGPMSGYGEVMMISDWDGTETVYGHMSAFLRHAGCVKAGRPIARVGAAGDATGPHLHFEVRVDGTPIDPLPFLARRGVHI